MLKKIYSRTLDSFKTIELDAGFNFILSESSSGKSNNGQEKLAYYKLLTFVSVQALKI